MMWSIGGKFSRILITIACQGAGAIQLPQAKLALIGLGYAGLS